MSKIIAFGEIMMRLTPVENSLISECRQFSVCYGGSEANVLVALSCLGENTEYLTALPKNELSDAVIKHLKSYSVGTRFIKVQGDTLGMYFLEEGFAGRPNKVIYNRSNAEVTHLCEDDFDFDMLFEDCSIFHISGISFALSESVKKLSFRLIKEAKERNIKVSFDFNYRGKLWSLETAASVYREIIPFVDILFCSQKDIDVFLNTTIEDFYNKYSCENLIVREREILPDGKHRAFVRGYKLESDIVKSVETDMVSFPVLERIGSGDAFDAGVLHILNNDGDLSTAINYGLACFVLKHTLCGDVFTLNNFAVENYITNSLEDVNR